MPATLVPTDANDDLNGGGQRAELVDRLIALRKALHGSISEIARLRRANAALRKDVTRLELELSAERSR